MGLMESQSSYSLLCNDACITGAPGSACNITEATSYSWCNGGHYRQMKADSLPADAASGEG